MFFHVWAISHPVMVLSYMSYCKQWDLIFSVLKYTCVFRCTCTCVHVKTRWGQQHGSSSITPTFFYFILGHGSPTESGACWVGNTDLLIMFLSLSPQHSWAQIHTWVANTFPTEPLWWPPNFHSLLSQNNTSHVSLHVNSRILFF